MIRAFANYQRFSEFSTAAIDYDDGRYGFEGNGVAYKAKLIGMEDVESDRDEQLSLDSLVKLKALVRARGEHKQKVQLNLARSGVQVIDEYTKAQLVCHEIQRISYVIMDPSDPRVFGYIYNTTDGRHQFWAIKTEGFAQSVVLALRDLFEDVYKQMNNSEEDNAQSDQVTTTHALLNEKTGTPQKSSFNSTTQSTKAPLFDDTWGASFIPTASQLIQTSEQQSAPDADPWGFSEPVVPVKQPAPRADSPVNMFNFPPPPIARTATITQPPLPRTATITQTAAPTADNNGLFSLFPANNNELVQPVQQTNFVSSQEQTNYMNWASVSTITSPPLPRTTTTTQPPAPTADNNGLFSLFPASNNELVQPVQQTNYMNWTPVSTITSPPLPRTATTTQPLALTVDNNDLFSLFPASNNELVQPVQQTNFVSSQEQTNYMNWTPVSTIASPPPTKPSSEFDLLGDFS